MQNDNNAWFALSLPGRTMLRCCVCHNEVDLKYPSLDHHPTTCPDCGVESVFLSWKGVLVQIVPTVAPPELARALRWAQANLDELELVTLLSSLAQVSQAVQAEAALMPM
jgi:hypothetical protein